MSCLDYDEDLLLTGNSCIYVHLGEGGSLIIFPEMPIILIN